jgi:hypothetical protein
MPADLALSFLYYNTPWYYCTMYILLDFYS